LCSVDHRTPAMFGIAARGPPAIRREHDGVKDTTQPNRRTAGAGPQALEAEPERSRLFATSDGVRCRVGFQPQEEIQ
jgi:hypothetical protein